VGRVTVTQIDGATPAGGTGQDGQDGVTPHIGGNGNWFIGATDTGVAARGPKGDTGETGPAGDGTSAVDLAAIPSIEDLPPLRTFDSRTISSTGTYVPLGVPSGACRVVGLALTWVPGGQIPATSAASFWLLELGKFVLTETDETTSGGPFHVFASKGTYGQFNGAADPTKDYGENVRQHYAWDLGAAVFDETEDARGVPMNVLGPRDSLYARWTKAGSTGTPGNMSLIDYSAFVRPIA
jgi:hypothetical protein